MCRKGYLIPDLLQEKTRPNEQLIGRNQWLVSQRLLAGDLAVNAAMDVWCGDVGADIWIAKAINPCYFETIASGTLLLLGAALAMMQVSVSVAHDSVARKCSGHKQVTEQFLLCKAVSRHLGKAKQLMCLYSTTCGITHVPRTLSKRYRIPFHASAAEAAHITVSRFSQQGSSSEEQIAHYSSRPCKHRPLNAPTQTHLYRVCFNHNSNKSSAHTGASLLLPSPAVLPMPFAAKL
jgi:hypothetical protein